MKLPKWFKKIFKLFGIKFHNLYYFEKDLRNPVEPVEALIPIEVKKATDKDIEEILNSAEKDDKKYIQYDIKEKSICYIASYNDKITGYTWINTDKILMKGGFLSTISNSGIYSFNSFVFPEYRSKKIFKSLISYVYKDMQKQGYKYVANLANVDNTPAVKGRESFNIKKKHIYIMLLPFNLRIIFNGPIGKGKLCK